MRNPPKDNSLVGNSLPGRKMYRGCNQAGRDYHRADGQLLLARYGDMPAGCVALRRIDRQLCEMKRMLMMLFFAYAKCTCFEARSRRQR
jgi:hypothetical protein